jgi:thioredoxin reductase
MMAISEFEYLIIGAGPAGLQLGYFLEKAKRNYLILEAGETPGTFLQKFPRHRQLISINKVYTGYDNPEINLRWDWHSLLHDSANMVFKDYSHSYFPHADKLVQYLSDFATNFEIKIKYGVQVCQIHKSDKFAIRDKSGNVYLGKRLIIATGLSQLYIPPIVGIELAEKYTDVSINPADFINQRVLIIGKGNSGFETANNLLATTSMIHLASPHPISMAWKTKYVGHLRAVNNNILDTYQLKSQNAILDATIDKIEYKNGKFGVSFTYTHAHSEQEYLVYDRVILCTGFTFDAAIFDESCQPELTINNRFPVLTSSWESPQIKDLYFAGNLMHSRDYQKKQSGFIHGFRYNIRAMHRIFELKYHNQPWTNQQIAATPKVLTDAILKRVNLSSSLWLQNGVLCDLIIIEDKEARYYEEVPVDYIQDSEFSQHDCYYTVSLEFGFHLLPTIADPFNFERVHKNDSDHAALSTTIHPIIRRWSYNQLINEHHVIEDLLSEWLEEVHIKPLLAYFETQFSLAKPLGMNVREL